MGRFAEEKYRPWLADDEKLEKKALSKTPESSPKKGNLDQNINDLKSHIWTSFLKNIILGIEAQ